MATTTPAAEALPFPKFNFVTKAFATDGSEGNVEQPPRFSAVASSTIVDRANDEISVGALGKMASRFREGVTIFVDHNKSAYNAFGITDTAEIVEAGQDPKTGARIYDLHISGPVNQPSARAMELWRTLDGGYAKLGTSIGAIVTGHEKKKGGGLKIDDLEVIEASIVGVPMNQRSWAYKAARAVKSFYGEPDQEEENDEMTKVAAVEADEPEPIIEKADETPAVEKAMKPCFECGATGDCEHRDTDKDGDSAADSDFDNKSADALPITTEAMTTTDAQEADAATPETASKGVQEADPAATPETAPESTEKAATMLFDNADVVELVQKTVQLAQIVSDKDAVIKSLTAEVERLTAENAEVQKTIERLMTLPLRPKAVAEVKTLSKRLPDFLAPEVANFLTKTAGD